MSRMLFRTAEEYMLAGDGVLRDHATTRLREALYELERNEDLLARAKRRWMYDQGRKAGVNPEEPATAAGLSWAWRKTAIAQDIVGDIQLWKSRLEVYAAVLGAVPAPVNVAHTVAPGRVHYGG